MHCICLADDTVQICCSSGLAAVADGTQTATSLPGVGRGTQHHPRRQARAHRAVRSVELAPLRLRNQPVRLTAAGEALVGPARRTLTSAAQAEQAVHHTRDVVIGTLRLGVSLSAQHLVPFASYLGEFTRDHPGIDLRLRYAPALTMISMLETGKLDCVIGPAVSQVPGVRMTRLAREPLHLVCRADHRLAEQAEVNMRQLANERFVEVPPGWTARLLSDAAFAGEGILRRVVCEVGDWELFLELVSAGVGIGFAPVGLQYPVLTAPDSVLRLIAVEGVRLERHIYLILPSVGETSPAARRFADQLLRIHPAGS